MKSTWIFAVLVGVAACSARESSGRDSALSNDLALASQVQQQQPATFNDTAVSPAPVPSPRTPARTKVPTRHADVPSPAPAISPPVVAPPDTAMAPVPQPNGPPQNMTPLVVPTPVRQIAAGTTVTLSSTAKVCTSTSRPGDKLVATVSSPIAGSNGATIPAGSSVVLEVGSVSQSGSDSTQIALRVKSMVINDASFPVSGDVSEMGPLEKVKLPGKPNDDRNKVIGGAVAGAIIGQILGHSTKGTVVGAAAGAATGAAVAKATQSYDVCLPQGAPLQLTLRLPISM